MKLLSVVAIAALISTSSLVWAAVEGIIDYSKIKCGISNGCTVSCGYWDLELKRIRQVQEIYLTLYENGVTKLELVKKNLRGTEIILLGPKSYYCDIDNP